MAGVSMSSASAAGPKRRSLSQRLRTRRIAASRNRKGSVPGAAEADVPGGGVGCRPLPRRDPVAPAVGVVTEVRATLLHPARAVTRARGISSPIALTKGRVEPVRRPLPDVAGHVVEAVAVGRERASPARSPRSRRRRCSAAGKSPCQTFILCSPPGSSSSPQGYAFPSSPPRAANSHSASVGSRAPAQAQYASASCHETWTTGWSSRSAIDECGPSGCAPVGAFDLPPPGGLHDAFAWAESHPAAGRRRRTTTRTAPRR